MTTRREFLEFAAAAAALVPGGGPRAFAQQQVRQADLLSFDQLGNVTLVHVADLHAQLVPVHFREPSVNIGVGEARGQVPHLTGAALLDRYGIRQASPEAYALSADDFTALAKAYGRMGGLDRIATVLDAIRKTTEDADPSRLITRHAVSVNFRLPLSYKPRIQAIPGVRTVAISTWFGGS